MKINDIFWMSYKDLSDKKIRTALTIVMVVIGVAAIVALTSLTAGISQSISTSLSSLGPTSIIVTSSSGTGFTIADTARLSSLPNITSVTPMLTTSANLYAGNQNVSVTLVGVTAQGLKQLLGGNVSLYAGSVYNDTIAPTAVLGHSVAFPSSAAGTQVVTVGQTGSLKILGRNTGATTVSVTGILQAHGGFIIPVDSAVFLPLSSAEVLLHRSSFSEMLVLASNTSSVNATSSLITAFYGSSARILTTSALLSTAASITGALGLLFGAIAGISLLVAAIGIMNIMLIAVYERTHEIGILKSVGFKNRHILLVFLFQALIIGLIGGILGIGMGAGASYGLAAALSSGSSSTSASSSSTSSGSFRSGGGGGFGGSGGGASSSSSFSFHPVFPVSTMIYAIVVAVSVSVIAGIYPAWRASKMEPIDALRQL